MITARAEIRVRYAETDAMGVAYHANYLAWFEVARTVMLEQIGVPYKQLDTEGFLLPVLEMGARYLEPARYDDLLLITACLEEIPKVRIRLGYTVHNQGRLITTGHTLHAFMSRAGLAIKPPLHVQQAFARAFACHGTAGADALR
ncbi:MAG: acyl-CoA thioesterase [Puniceicoccales bacterium]|nr:acyl-CoA thioesterase [Puniceicoccales bacterium]